MFSLLLAGIFALSGCAATTDRIPSGSLAPTSPSAGPIATVPSGKKLDLSNQGLTKVPDEVFNQTDLEELDISHNRIGNALQSQIGQLSKLKILRANDNLMTGVPAEVGKLSKLEILDLSNNQLTGLPNELGNLSKLKELNLSGNNYSAQDLATILKTLPATVRIIK